MPVESHTNIDLGKLAVERLFELVLNDAASYMLLSNIYAMVGRWGVIGKRWRLMEEREITKKPG